MARFPFSVLIALAFTTALVACETVSEAPPSEKAGRESRTHVVAAAHPVAVAAGEKVLRDGGSAADAAVAIQATLTLVEPQSSGIGGGSVCALL
jgi:gamma-glutamyltranspeptidase/glutathione hydrolase